MSEQEGIENSSSFLFSTSSSTAYDHIPISCPYSHCLNCQGSPVISFLAVPKMRVFPGPLTLMYLCFCVTSS